MPGGNATIPSNSQLDLQGFLARRRITPKQWLTANNITSTEAIGRLIRGSKWFVAPELRSEMESALISLLEPATAMSVVEQEIPVKILQEPEVSEPEPEPEPSEPTQKKLKGKGRQ
jgi:hypothetical protein